MNTTFGKLAIGATFDFVAGPWGKSYYGGPYIKISARKYQEVESGKQHTIGSLSAKVEKMSAPNPSRKIPVGKFIPARLNPNGTVTFKVYPKKRAKKRASVKRKLAKRKTTKKAARKRNPYKVYKGIFYFDTYANAENYAHTHGYPDDRIIRYDRGWAIQLGRSGSYIGTEQH